MKFSVGDFVKITGGTLSGCHGIVYSTCKKTIWILLVEGSREGHVVCKRNMKFVSKAQQNEQEERFPKYNRTGNGNELFVAMPKTHKYSKDDIKDVFYTMMEDHGIAHSPDHEIVNSLVLPKSRNCILYFNSSHVVKELLSKKSVVMIGTNQCRLGLHYGAKMAPLDETAATSNRENVAVHANAMYQHRLKSPETKNSRADAFKQGAIDLAAKRRRFN